MVMILDHLWPVQAIMSILGGESKVAIGILGCNVFLMVSLVTGIRGTDFKWIR
jgi:hypothetical protein